MKVSQLSPIVGALLTDLLYIIDLSAGSAGSKNITLDELRNIIAVTLTAGTGLSGGGDTTANRTFDLNISGLPVDASAAESDKLIIDDGALKAITKANFLKGVPVQFAVTSTVLSTTGTPTATPNDDTKPDQSVPEGFEVTNINTTFTPLDAANTLHLFSVINFSWNGAGDMCVSYFKDAIAEAIHTQGASGAGSAISAPNSVLMMFSENAGSTSARTYKVRIGNTTVAVATINGFGAARKYGGAMTSITLIVETRPV